MRCYDKAVLTIRLDHKEGEVLSKKFENLRSPEGHKLCSRLVALHYLGVLFRSASWVVEDENATNFENGTDVVEIIPMSRFHSISVDSEQAFDVADDYLDTIGWTGAPVNPSGLTH